MGGSNQDAAAAPLKTVFVGDRATAKQLRKARLVVVEGPDKGKELVISKETIRIGRAAVNDLILTDTSVSGLHMELSSAEHGYKIHDNGSTNGTWFGELQILDGLLPHTANFRVGSTRLKVEPLDEVVEIPLSKSDRLDMVVGTSVRMREIFATLEKVAPSELTVHIEGQTGTGKERVAHAIHNLSRRAGKPFVVQDCGAIPKELVESILFGHEKGAFTGAQSQHKGCFEQADGGTIFLDEIGELDLAMQPKLLRVLETHELKRVGGDRTIKSDVRVIAATNRDLRAMVEAGEFREDLYFRLSVIQVHLPPLRERREDIPLLAREFAKEVASYRGDAAPIAFSPEALARLGDHDWPGNVRELKNVIERAASLCDGPEITVDDLAFQPIGSVAVVGGPGENLVQSTFEGIAFKQAKAQVLDRFELAYLSEVIERHEGNISRAAAEAGLTRFHLRELLKKHGLQPTRGRKS